MGRLLKLKSASSPERIQDQETAYAPSTTATDATTHSLNEIPNNDGVNRNTSIRSIMTLPPYHPSPHPDERLIAREGERAGVDTVIEYPETAEEEEARREEDMDSLYQIRQARRREINERNERRRERQAAREASDWARLEQLRLQSQMRARARDEAANGSAGSSRTSLPGSGPPVDPTAASSLIAEHNARTASRDRRVSSVSYADLGLARHDGTRLRADSAESDHRPLLDSAASMGSDPRPTSRHSSLFRTPLFRTHNRTASAESVVTTDSDLAAEITPQTSSGDRTGSDRAAIHTPSASGPDTGSESSPPMEEPPRYEVSMYEDEEAPPYTSPVVGRGDGVPRLPSVRVNSSLPVIEITGSTPAGSVAASPAVGRGEAEEANEHEH